MTQTPPAESDDSAAGFSFPAVRGKKVTAAFDGDRLTSDGGVQLLGDRLGLDVAIEVTASGMHGRKLELEYANGPKAIVLLGQRFGYWRVAGNLPLYDFNATPTGQASALFGLNATVSGTGESHFAVTKN